MSRQGKKKKRIWLILLIVFFVLLAGAVSAFIYFYKRFKGNVKIVVTVEAGDPLPEKADFLARDWELIELTTDMGKISNTVPGVHIVELKWLWFTSESTLVIKDTVPPEGETKDITCETGTQLSAEDFLTRAEDLTGVKAYFLQNPIVDTEGVKKVEIYLEDGGGNRTLLTAELTLYNPKKGPQIKGTENKEVYAGESVTYRPGVTVSDEMDPSPELTIDSSAVDLDTPGVYPVTYTAKDKFGRIARNTIYVNVLELPENYYDMILGQQLVEEKVQELIHDGMTDIEKCFAIYRWVRLNIPWNNARTERDEVGQVLAGMQGHPGDCYTHAITCKALLDEAGIENIMIERDPGPGKHYWLMVKVDGDWYHMDPSPVYTHVHICFLQTDEQVASFSTAYRPHYYIHDYSKYPATPYTSPVVVKYKNGDYILEYVDEQ